MDIITGFIFGFLLIRLIISGVNLTLRTRLPELQTGQEGLVSVLIPARNEAQNIDRLLQQTANNAYRNIEILVYDDDSDDNTAGIVQQNAAKDNRIKLIKTQKLPEYWLGKNHACYQLAGQAQGNYLLFLDADVSISSELIINSLAYLKKHRLSLLSIFPQQQMKSFGERITVPVMNWILTSLLPLPLIKSTKQSSLAAANGQFMLFEAGNYHKNQWHKRFKKQAVEDINIMRAIKKQNNKGHTLLSNGQIKCRMYTNFQEALNGFSKNTHEFFGKSYMLMGLFALITTFGFIPVYFYSGIAGLGLYFLGAVLLRLFTSLASRQNAIYNILLAPLQQLAFLFIIYRSVLNKARGYGVWKGRRIGN